MPCKYEDFCSIPRNYIKIIKKNLSIVVHACNLNTSEKKAVKALGLLASQPSLGGKRQASEEACLNK